jgi:hydroxymethylpyrimidine/phosphomethylpyrimidine kinase
MKAHAARPNTPRCVLTIAGSDSGGGAGVQADARTIRALGGHALTAITAITAQNTRGVRAWRPVALDLLAAQIAAVCDDFPVAAIKTGLLPGAAAIDVVAGAAARHDGVPLVIDPVIGSTTGTRFLPAAALRRLKTQLLPRARLVTPNWPELAALTGRAVRTFDDAAAAAAALAAECGCAVLAKGGHAPGAQCADCLVTPAGEVRWFRSPRIATRNTHGTGCVLSAAIATRLARGDALTTAVTRARTFLLRALRAGRTSRWGGAGPALV